MQTAYTSKVILLFSLILPLSTVAWADHEKYHEEQRLRGPSLRSIYAQIGGLSSVSIGYAQKMTDRISIRAEYNQGIKSNYKVEVNSVTYSGKLQATDFGLLGDFYLKKDYGLRVTVGLRQAKTKAELENKVAANSNFVFNGYRYFSQTEGVMSALIEYPKTMPYLGLGYTTTGITDDGLRFTFDIGATYGKPTTKIALTNNLSSTVSLLSTSDLSDQISAEEKRINDVIPKILPVVRFGARYDF